MTITGISSMATRQVLADLAIAYEKQSGVTVAVVSVAGWMPSSGCRPARRLTW